MADEIPVTIRSFDRRDLAACKSLYTHSRIGGQQSDNDTGLDIDDIFSAYMETPGSHFWVAEISDGQVVGMIGVQHHEQGTGEIRRLRVRHDVRRRGIGWKLVETALQFCAEQNYLKVTVDTFIDQDPMIKMFEKFSFQHDRTKNVSGRDLLYFYLDIYSRGDTAADKE